ncbi:zinc finger protein OZF-like [Culicoides brevitarsis]|uniref:zinc finger protein OZF-like n=1 Tax=Culicoides brevitarsis TaxID=469753 RepID=UPI00307C2E55
MSSLEQVCRLCLNPCDSDNVDLDHGFNARMRAAIEEIFQILDIAETNFPKKVCLLCKEKTLEFYNYFTLVKSNQNILRNALGKKVETLKIEPNTSEESIQFVGISGSSRQKPSPEQEQVLVEVCVKEEGEKIDFDQLYDERDPEDFLPEAVKIEEKPKFAKPVAPKKLRVTKSSKSKSTKDVSPKKYNKKGQKGHRSCDLCGATYEYRELLVTHMKRRHIFEDVECNICHKKFDNKVKLQSHTAHHNKKHMCEICSKSYVSPNQLKRHMQVHKVVSNDFICSKCGEGFATRNLLADHVRKSHDGDDDGQLFTCMCDICGKKFLEESSMNVHKRTHNPNIIKALYCPVSTCGERMRDQAHLSEHMQIHSIVYNCTTCARKFLNAGDLADHEKTHENEHRPFECQICQRRYSNKNQLNVHVIRVHRKNEANLHECELCSKTFLAAWELRVHERSHSSEKIAKCPMCERSYKSTNDIKKHMAVNHTAAHYRCPGTGCDKQFKTKLHFRKHFKKHHPETFTSDTALKQYWIEDKEEMANVMAIYARTFLNRNK